MDKKLDTTHHDKRLKRRLDDPEFRQHFEEAQRLIKAGGADGLAQFLLRSEDEELEMLKEAMRDEAMGR